MLRGPLVPGVFAPLMARLTVELEERAKVALEGTGLLVETRARQSISSRSHPYRTPTPASRGGPPAMVSGTLAGSLTHEIDGMLMRVGTTGGQFPPYGKGRTPASLYGLYLEKLGAGINHITYPFLLPAFKAVEPGILTVVRGAFAGFGAG